MIVTFSFKLGTIDASKEGAQNGYSVTREVAEIMHNHMKGSPDYIESNAVVNFDEATATEPGHAAMFIDMPACENLPDTMLRFQQALVEFMNRSISATTIDSSGTIIIPQQNGAVG